MMDSNSVTENCVLNGDVELPTSESEPSVGVSESSFKNLSESIFLNKSESANTKPDVNTISSDYVFGSNISARVVNNEVSQGASSNLWSLVSTDNDSVPFNSVFTALAKAVNVQSTNFCTDKKLADSVKEFVETKNKSALHLKKVKVVTGEEEDNNVFSQSCRAFVFDVDKQTWNSLGTVMFHLSDISSKRSRIVVRLDSTQKLIINTSIWPKMPVTLTDLRKLRIGAVCELSSRMKSYIFVFHTDELASTLYELLLDRKSRCLDIHEVSSLNYKHHLNDDNLFESDDNIPIASKIIRGACEYDPVSIQSSDSLSSNSITTNINSNDDCIQSKQDFKDFSNVNKEDKVLKKVDYFAGNVNFEIDKDMLLFFADLVVSTMKCFKLLPYSSMIVPKLSDDILNDNYDKLTFECRFYEFDTSLREWIDRGLASVTVIHIVQQNVSVDCHLSYLTVDCKTVRDNQLCSIYIWSGANVYKVGNSICVTSLLGNEDNSIDLKSKVSLFCFLDSFFRYKF